MRLRGLARRVSHLEAAAPGEPGAASAGLAGGTGGVPQDVRSANWTETVQKGGGFRSQDPLAGVHQVALAPRRPTRGTFQSQTVRETRGIGLLEGEAEEGGVQVRGSGVRAPPRGLREDGAAAFEENLPQRLAAPAAIRSRIPPSHSRL